jgi:hypothetical protein
VVATRRTKLADRLRSIAGGMGAAVILVIFLAFGLNSCIRTSGRMPPEGAVLVLSERKPDENWYRSIESASWGDFTSPPHANVMTRAEAESLGMKPYPGDDELFYQDRGFLQDWLEDRQLLPRARRWIVLKGGEWQWNNGAVLSRRDRRRLGME